MYKTELTVLQACSHSIRSQQRAISMLQQTDENIRRADFQEISTYARSCVMVSSGHNFAWGAILSHNVNGVMVAAMRSRALPVSIAIFSSPTGFFWGSLRSSAPNSTS